MGGGHQVTREDEVSFLLSVFALWLLLPHELPSAVALHHKGTYFSQKFLVLMVSPSSALKQPLKQPESTAGWLGEKLSRRLISFYTYFTAVDLGGGIGYGIEVRKSMSCPLWVPVWKQPFISFTGSYFCLMLNGSGHSAISLQAKIVLFPGSLKKSPYIWFPEANFYFFLPMLKLFTESQNHLDWKRTLRSPTPTKHHIVNQTMALRAHPVFP